MKIIEHILKKNDCYKAGEKIKVKGLMLHSTGANNPKLSRYIDDPDLGDFSSNHWNQAKPGGRSVCVHGFIGKDKDGNVKTYQTLPWNYRGWHAGGDANNTHIGVEICEDDLKDGKYFDAVYDEAVELFAYLCKKYDLDEKDILCHSEAHAKGIASNHSDVMHWFPKHGKSMDTFRADVKKALKGEVKQPEVESKPSAPQVGKSINVLAQEVIDGKHGTGAEREKSLGIHYEQVQERVNEILGGSKPKVPSKTIDQLAQEVIDGKHGSGNARKKSLGSKYDAVQDRVNDILNGESKPKAKTIDQLVEETIRGVYGSGKDRQRALGSNYAAVQKEVNRRLR